MPLLMQPSVLLAFCATAAHCSLILSLLPTRTPRSLSTELLLSWVDPSLCFTPRLCFPRCKTLHLSLLNFTKFLLALYSSLSRSSCRVALPSKVSTSPLSSVLSANHQGTLDHIFQITYKDTIHCWAQYQSLGHPACDRLPVCNGAIYPPTHHMDHLSGL